MWEVARVPTAQPKLIDEYLSQGYEPFAVVLGYLNTEILYLKREVGEVVEGEYEIHSEQPKPVKRTGRRAPAKAKG